MTTPIIQWNIQHGGHSWSSEELFTRDEMLPGGVRVKIHNGKLLFNDEDRLTLLGMLLKNIGLGTAVSKLEALSKEAHQKISGEGEKSCYLSLAADSHDYNKAPSVTALLKPLRPDTGK